MRSRLNRTTAAMLALALTVPLATAAAQTNTTPAPTPLPMTGDIAQPRPSGFEIPSTSEPIAVGDSVDGELTEEVPALAYTFSTDGMQYITATLTAPNIDTYLVLTDATGAIVATNDDGAGDLDSRIRFAAQDGSEYTLVATTYGYFNGTGINQGSFTLTLETSDIRLIEYTQSVNESLTVDAPADFFAFTGQAGDTVAITHVSEDFDSTLRLLDPSGIELMFNDDGAGNLDARIGPFTLPETGLYQIEASSLNGMSAGDYTLSLERIDVTQLAYGEAAETALDGEGAAYFQFRGTYDDVVTIRVESDVDTRLALNDSSNYLLVSDEDSGAGNNPELLDYILPSDGLYTLVVESTLDGAPGTVSVEIERGVLPSLNDGPATFVFTSNLYQRRATFTPETNTTYVVSLESTSLSGSQVGVDLTQFGSVVASATGTNTGRVTFEFTAYSSDPLTVSVYDYSGYGNQVEISIAEAR